MIVPNYWAEARTQHRSHGKQITLRRYGWSLTSAEEASAMAETRVQEALRRVVAGEKLIRREPKRAYNGATGVPIREEVLERRGNDVITRNAYGAHCLNSPTTLFADIDFDSNLPIKVTIPVVVILCALTLLAGIARGSIREALVLLFVSLFIFSITSKAWYRTALVLRGGSEQVARRRIAKFLSGNPKWNMRLYRTPAGIRVLATHQPLDPTSSEVGIFFNAVSADPIYVRMCLNQRCFRARLTAKPWRIGISSHMRPRPGIWPVDSSRLGLRNEWIARYEERAAAFASCRYIGSVGSGTIHESVAPTIAVHDLKSRALDAKIGIA